jgi:biopolymer transport protein ExbD
VGYGELMEVMNLLRGAGYLKIALVGLETLPAADAATPAPQAGTGQ